MVCLLFWGFPVVSPLSPLICFREAKCTVHKQLQQKLFSFFLQIFTYVFNDFQWETICSCNKAMDAYYYCYYIIIIIILYTIIIIEL